MYKFTTFFVPYILQKDLKSDKEVLVIVLYHPTMQVFPSNSNIQVVFVVIQCRLSEFVKSPSQ